MDLDRLDQEVRKLMHWRDSQANPSAKAVVSAGGPSSELDAAFADLDAKLTALVDAVARDDTRLNALETRINELAALIQAPAAPPSSPPPAPETA